MKQTIKKISMTLVLLLALFATIAGQGGVVHAAGLGQSASEAPLAPGLTWNDLGQTTRSIQLNIQGDSISLSGATFQAAERFGETLPQDIAAFYSNEQLFNAGWTSDNAFETPEGLHQIFYNESTDLYLAVEFLTCSDDASAKCLTVWLSAPAATAEVVPGSAAPQTDATPDAAVINATWGKVAPADTATTSTTSVTLSWGAYSPTPDKYSYCIKAGSKCADNDPNWTGNLTNTSIKLTLDPGTKYYWQVKAITCLSCTPKKYVYADSGVWWTFTTGAAVTISGNTGVGGVTLTYSDNGTKTVTSATNGNYTISVPKGWSGTVTPTKTSFVFSPTSRPYNNLTSNQTNQNYTTVVTITGNAGVGTSLSYLDGTVKTVNTDGSGNYTISVPSGWSGTVTPTRSCTTFTPGSLVYPALAANQVNQNYTAGAKSQVVISGYAGSTSVSLTYTDGVTPLTTLSDASTGNYTITVSCPWTGTVTPAKAGLIFTPAIRTYTAQGFDRPSQNFTALTAVSISGNAGTGATISYMYAGAVRSVSTDGSGNYTLSVPSNWSGRLTASKSSTVFSPASIDLANVTTTQTGKDFTQSAGYNITGNGGVAGATLSFTDGVAKTVTADGSGNYSLVVSPSWAGDVVPSKPGYTFTPNKITYPAVNANASGQNYVATPTATFSDVATSFWAWQQIETLAGNGITSGCSASPLKFCPADAVTREQMAVFIVRAIHGAGFVPPVPTGIFSDAPVGYWAAPWIEQLYADGITTGCKVAPVRFCPTDSVTREQMAIFLLRARYGSSYTPPAAAGLFSDAPLGYWSASWLEQLYADGITTGCANSPLRFCPTSVITRDQVSVFLVRTFGLK